MPKIRMVKTTPGSLDGFTRTMFMAEQEYEVPHELAKAFISHMGVATIVRERKAMPEAPEKAVAEAVPENKVVLTEEEAEAESEDVIEERAEDDKPMAMRVYQLADELGIGYKKVIKAAKALSIYVSAAASGLSEEEAERIKLKLKG